jgi:hypothetical protein
VVEARSLPWEADTHVVQAPTPARPSATARDPVNYPDRLARAGFHSTRELRGLIWAWDDLQRVGVERKVADQVVRLALLTKEAGMDGVVASPHEVADIREACGRRFVIVTPGIRPSDGNRNDQQRIMTPQNAVRGGVDYIVVGRPIIEAKDPVGAARAIVADMQLGAK